MQLHLVGGFLGSGKTTAIITVAKYLIAQGSKVGVVTNDQGKYLVDTNFFLSNNIPTVEVTNGCFCCNYENLEEKLNQLQANEKPDVVFAESVGSCGDIVATVLKPLLELAESKTPPTSFSVFADSGLLLPFLSGEELPFSENVLYILKKQIEEARILVINKIDLLTTVEVHQIIELSHIAFPEKIIKLQNSKSEEDVIRWYQLITSGLDITKIDSVEMDYERYGQGEAELAWLDQELRVETNDGKIGTLLTEMIQSIQEKLKMQKTPIGHLKFMISTELQQIKISITTLEQNDWKTELAQLVGLEASLLINARVQMSPKSLQELVNRVIISNAGKTGVRIDNLREDSFRPGFPNPTHRMKN